MLGRIYLDHGDRFAGDRVPPEPVTVLIAYTARSSRPSAPVWPWLRWSTPPKAGGPLNVAVRRARGDIAVLPTRRGRYWRLRVPREPVDLGAVFAAYGGCLHRGCTWPGCPALMDAVSNAIGDPGAVRGWHHVHGWAMCARHSAVWTHSAHFPFWDRDRARPAMVCTCGHVLHGATLGALHTAYRAHLAGLGE